jgi:diaminopimelate epimerase
MHGLAFTKGHGTENDFVLVPDPEGRHDLTPDEVRALADRRAGVGGDGVIRVVPTRLADDPAVRAQSGQAAWFMDYRNADGSVSEMCGNGTRVFAAYLLREGLERGGEFAIATRAGPQAGAHRQRRGMPSTWAPPASTTPRAPGRPGSMPSSTPTADRSCRGCVSTSATRTPSSSCRRPWRWATSISAWPRTWPRTQSAGTNVEFVQILGSGHIAMRVHERGVGETRSCGTGAVAAAAATRWWDGADDTNREWTVDVPGGRLTVTFTDAGTAELAGPRSPRRRRDLDRRCRLRSETEPGPLGHPGSRLGAEVSDGVQPHRTARTHPLSVPEPVVHKAARAGAQWWLDALPELVADLERDWRITVGRALGGGTEAFVAEATTAEGERAVLKLVLPQGLDAARHEITTLRLADGQGCARLLRDDATRGALLVERLGSVAGRCRVQLLAAAGDPRRPLRAGMASPPPTLAFRPGRRRPAISSTSSNDSGPSSTACLLPPGRRLCPGVRPATGRRALNGARPSLFMRTSTRGTPCVALTGAMRSSTPTGCSRSRKRIWASCCVRTPTTCSPGILGRGTTWLARRTGTDPIAIWEWGAIERVSTGLLLCFPSG